MIYHTLRYQASHSSLEFERTLFRRQVLNKPKTENSARMGGQCRAVVSEGRTLRVEQHEYSRNTFHIAEIESL